MKWFFKGREDWPRISLEDQRDFLMFRRIESDGYGFRHPDFQKIVHIYRKVFETMPSEDVDEIFSTVKPYSSPTDIQKYLKAGRNALES